MTEHNDTPETPGGACHADARPAWSIRFLACGLYMGVAPIAWFAPRTADSGYWKTHFRQALTLWAVLGLIVLTLFALVLALSVLMVHNREWAETRSAEVWILSFGRKCLLAWAVFWVYGLWRCLRGSAVPVSFLAFLSGRAIFRRAGMAVTSVVFCGVAVITPLTLHANHLVTQDPSRGKVFMLYDDLDMFPSSLFSLVMYRLSCESVRHWGRGSAVLLPLGREAIDLAVQQGVFIFIASHGTARGLLLDGKFYRPEDVPKREDGSGPAYVYLASCDSGARKQAWEQAFSPATVKTYDRLTPTLEHLWWLWSEGPEVLRNLHAETR